MGLKKEEVEYIGESAETIFYDIPKTIRSKVLGGKFRGQEQKMFLLRLKKDDQKIKLDNEEFQNLIDMNGFLIGNQLIE